MNVSPNTQLKLHPFFRLRLGPPAMCDLLLEQKTLELPDLRYVQLLAELKEPGKVEDAAKIAARVLEVDTETARGVILDLVETGILCDASFAPPELAAVKHWIDRGWMSALVLHLQTRDLPYGDNGAEDATAAVNEDFRRRLAEKGPPSFWSSYPNRPAFPLPTDPLPERAVDEVLLQRRSNKPFKKLTMPVGQLGAMLKHANVETVRLRKAAEARYRADPSVLLKSSFSAVESYFFAFDVQGLGPGLYHYDPREHSAVLLREGLFRDGVRKACIGQKRAGEGAVALVLTAVWERYMFRYQHPRAFRTLMINLSELAQKYLLLATTFDYEIFLTPQFLEKEAEPLMGMKIFEEFPSYVITLG